MRARPSIKIELTAEQRKQVHEAANLEATAQELTPEVLEERIAPAINLNSSKSNAF